MKSCMVSRLVLMSVNMLSSLLVNWYPHSVFSFTKRLRSASSDTCTAGAKLGFRVTRTKP